MVRKIHFCIALLLLTSTVAIAQKREALPHDKRSIDVVIYFPYDQAYIDSSYMNNLEILTVVDILLKDSSYVSNLERIEVMAQSSPEGTIAYNTRLSERRRLSLQNYFLTNYPEIDPSLWYFGAVAENWDLFRKYLVEDDNLPSSEAVMAIVDSDRDLDAKEWLLRTMQGGEPWLYIKDNILPSQRLGASILFIPRASTISVDKPLLAPRVAVPTAVAPAPLPLTPYRDPKLIFAVKSNLVLDLLTVVNLGVEIPIGERFSVVGEVVYPWWRSWPTNFTMQIESYHAEVKYWLGDRSTQEQLQGWYVGAYGGWGRYDIQPLTREGVQGSFVDFGVEAGFAHPIARNLHLEYMVGLGYVSTSYYDYYMVRNTDEYGDIKVIPYPWAKNSLQTVMPTRCGVSLVWTIKSRGGVRR